MTDTDCTRCGGRGLVTGELTYPDARPVETDCPDCVLAEATA